MEQYLENYSEFVLPGCYVKHIYNKVDKTLNLQIQPNLLLRSRVDKHVMDILLISLKV